MPSFSKKSKEKLKTCHPDLIRIFHAVIQDYDCMVLEGSRSFDRQRELVDSGMSKTMNSKHLSNPSRAIDVTPYPIPKKWGEGNSKEKAKFYFFAGIVMSTANFMGIELVWGGDWDSDQDFNDQTFDDLVHFELKRKK